MTKFKVNKALFTANCHIRRYTLVIISFNLAFLGSFGFDVFPIEGISINFIRFIISTIFLLLIPGSLILKLLNFDHINKIETLVFTIGLSASFLMFFGFFLNIILPFFGFTKPLSEVILVISLSAVIFLLTFIVSITHNKENNIENHSFESDASEMHLNSKNPVLFLILLILLSILGAQLINFFNFNYITFLVFIIIALIPILVAFGKFNKQLYPFIIFSIALALLYHRSLISMYITGWDSQVEYYYSSLVIINSFWDVSLPSNVNSMLSTSIFAPSFSKISGIPLTWVYKIIYPFIYSFVPLAIYRICQKQFDSKIAFFSTYLIMSTFIFYQVMLDLPRQQLAELFMVLVLMLIFSKQINQLHGKILYLLFIISIIVSHYGLSYLFMFLLVITWILTHTNYSKKDISMTFGGTHEHEKYGNFSSQKYQSITLNIIFIYVVFALTWHMNTSSSSIFISVVNVGDKIISSIFTDFLTQQSSQAVNISVTQLFPMHQITKYLHILVQFFIAIGILSSFIKTRKNYLQQEYISFSFANFIMLGAAIILPFFASALNFNRIYQMTLLILAPFFILGIFQTLTIARIQYNNKSIFIFISIFLAIFILFNSGVIYELANEPSSMSINGEFDYPRYNSREVSSILWLNERERHDSGIDIYTDDYNWQYFTSIGIKTHSYTNANQLSINKNAYFYLGSSNIKNREVVLTNWTIPTSPVQYSTSIEDLAVNDMFQKSNLIYNNKDATVYYL